MSNLDYHYRTSEKLRSTSRDHNLLNVREHSNNAGLLSLPMFLYTYLGNISIMIFVEKHNYLIPAGSTFWMLGNIQMILVFPSLSIFSYRHVGNSFFFAGEKHEKCLKQRQLQHSQNTKPSCQRSRVLGNPAYAKRRLELNGIARLIHRKFMFFIPLWGQRPSFHLDIRQSRLY